MMSFTGEYMPLPRGPPYETSDHGASFMEQQRNLFSGSRSLECMETDRVDEDTRSGSSTENHEDYPKYNGLPSSSDEFRVEEREMERALAGSLQDAIARVECPQVSQQTIFGFVDILQPTELLDEMKTPLHSIDVVDCASCTTEGPDLHEEATSWTILNSTLTNDPFASNQLVVPINASPLSCIPSEISSGYWSQPATPSFNKVDKKRRVSLMNRGSLSVSVADAKRPRTTKRKEDLSVVSSGSVVVGEATASVPTVPVETLASSMLMDPTAALAPEPFMPKTVQEASSPKQYAVEHYPMALLTKEAFIVEGLPKEVCIICLNNKYEQTDDTLLFRCRGTCRRSFHIQCLQLEVLPSDPESFQCPECFTGFRKCLACGIEGNDLEKCQHDECGEYYHAACLAGPKSSNAKLRICPKHKCYTCKLQRREPKGAKHKLSACNRCPVAYHFNFMCFPAEAQICVDNSKYMTCWRHIKDLEARPAKSKQRKKAKGGTRARGIKTDVCFYCLDGGELLLCDSCPFSAHSACIGLDEVPEGSWHCPECMKGVKPMLLDIVWYKFGIHRVWPCQIVPESICPANIVRKHPGGNMFILRFLGTKDYSFASSKEILPYDTCDPVWKQKAAKADFRRGLTEAVQLSQDLLKLKVKFVAENFEGARPDYNRIQKNKAISPATFGVVQSTNNKEDYDICNCKGTDDDPCGPTSNCINRDMQYECHPKFCPAEGFCRNQRLRRKQYPSLKTYYTADRGWALKAMEDIPEGGLAIEYVGEIITVEERNRRLRAKLVTGDVNFYFLDLTKGRVIDAGPSGNLARFANHSCEANCFSQKWEVDGDTRIALIAIREIKKGEEITFDYRWEYEYGVTSRECLCAAENCRRKIGGKTYNLKNCPGLTSF